MSKKKIVAVVGIAGTLALVLGILGVAYAYAQGPQPPLDGRPFYGRGRFSGGELFGAARMRGGYSLIEATADVTGLSQEDVVAALKDGQTFADIAESQGVDAQDIVDAAVAEHRARLQEAVDTGRLTEERMEEMLADVEEHITEQLDETHEPRLFGTGRFGGGLFGGHFLGRFGEGSWITMFDAVADALGLDPAGLFAELHDGKTVAEIAEETGVELEALEEAVEAARVEARREAIERAVEDGRLSEEEAEWLLEGLDRGYGPAGWGFLPGAHCGSGRGFAPRAGGRGRGW